MAARGFYLLGLSNSGLAGPARAGDTAINVRSTTDMSVGDTIGIDTGPSMETRKIASIGTAAGNHTTLWQPLPDGPVITIPAGSTSVPVTSVTGFVVGEKIGIGYGATYPTVAKALERYAVATITAVGKPGTQAFLGADAQAGATNIKVTSIANISPGDKIRLDIDTVGHGIETVTVTRVGTQSNRTALTADAGAGANNIKVTSVPDFAGGQTILIDTGENLETAVIATVGTAGATTVGSATAVGATIIPVAGGAGFTAGQTITIDSGANQETAVVASTTGGKGGPGSGATITVAAPLTLAHTADAQVSGTGITLTAALTRAHASGAQIAGNIPTPGAPNQYYRKELSAKKSPRAVRGSIGAHRRPRRPVPG